MIAVAYVTDAQSEPTQTSTVKHSAANYFSKKFHLRCLKGFSVRLWVTLEDQDNFICNFTVI